MDLWLARLRFNCKKTLHASEQSRPDVGAQRKAWLEKLVALPAAKLVFVDESGANTQMTRRHGRSPVGGAAGRGGAAGALCDDDDDRRGAVEQSARPVSV